ncbi:MAG: tRNA (N(6)-L-threonylcarbamoyladenosine(37)-C(2))-methylthiotransferase MtaB [Dehalococcoidia bacterium]|nr:tRNA (N(6)-L-threonylcarbamoyladenosine(37)-C(2))-methylthiotransferase MtaB [Dehalococcoidia bacterium]
MKIAFYTLGCKLNQAETESLVAEFSEAGFQIVPPDNLADIYIANTCTVTHIADRKSRQWLRLAKRRNPQAFIIATGCYAQRAPQELAPIADLVLNNKEKERLLEIVTDLLATKSSSIELLSPHQSERTKQFHAHNGISRIRSLIKIQDGCHSACTYCIVPHVRDREYSVPSSQIIKETKKKVALGYKEVVLTGTKIGHYKDATPSASEGPGADLADLIERILYDTNIERLRLSSLQPQELSPKLLALLQDKRVCRHFHLALQSGSDAVLQRMRRCYSLDDYQTAMDSIRETIPGAAITTDVIVGFPAESDEEFEQSYLFCQQAGFAKIHVFSFSPRPGTAAVKVSNQVRDKVKKERSRRMLELSWISNRNFEEQFLGQTMWVLWEKETNPSKSIYSGLTDSYIRVFTRSQKCLTNTITPVKLAGFNNQGMWGELVS